MQDRRHLKLDRESSGATVTVMVGDIIDLRLPETPSTGYRWHMASAAERLIECEQDDFLIPETRSKGSIGGSGTRFMSFRAVNEGETVLVLRYCRSWEASTNPLDHFSLTIKVAKS